MKKLSAIFGAGGHARTVCSILRAKKNNILGIFDDSYCGYENIQGIKIIGKYDDILRYKNKISEVYIAIGDNKSRKRAFNYLSVNKFELPYLIHPKSIQENDFILGEGTVVCLGSVISTEVSIGIGSIINTACSIDHETDIADFVHIAPRVAIAGRVSIGKNSFIGINSCIVDKINIGKNVIIGAGSVILNDVPDGSKIVGVFS